MTGFVRKATLLTGACSLFAAATAIASVPSPATSVFPGGSAAGSGVAFIRFVRHQNPPANMNAHQASAFAGNPRYTFTIKDFAGNPVAGSVVEMKTTNCTDLVLCEVPFTDVPSQTVDCPNKILRGVTNALGQVTLAGSGGGLNTGSTLGGGAIPNAGAGAGCVQILADGIPLGTATAVIYDQNGAENPPRVPSAAAANGMDGGFGLDAAAFFTDAANPGSYRGRSDYSAFDLNGCGGGAGDCGVVNLGDFSVMLGLFGENAGLVGSIGGCSTASGAGEAAGINYCP